MKRIIAFSLWGNIPYYTVGAIKNALLAKIYFPEWICRYYYDNSVPNEIIKKLKSLDNTELIYIEKPSGATRFKQLGQYGSLWRYAVFNDDDVEIWMVRDTDSRISPYEKKYIDEFINSNKIIHSFRNESEPLLRAGMMSFKNYSLIGCNYEDNRIVDGKKLDIKAMMNYINKDNTPFYCDEKFLKDKLLPLYKKFYSYNLRNDNSVIFPKECGLYVGAMLDCNDNWIKDHNYKENNKCISNNKIINIDNSFNYNMLNI
jgi:hypothetical protein